MVDFPQNPLDQSWVANVWLLLVHTTKEKEPTQQTTKNNKTKNAIQVNAQLPVVLPRLL